MENTTTTINTNQTVNATTQAETTVADNVNTIAADTPEAVNTMVTALGASTTDGTALKKTEKKNKEDVGIPGFRVLGMKKIGATNDYIVTLLFENPQIGLKETVSLSMAEVKSPAKFRKKIPPAFMTPYNPSKMIEDLQYEISQALRHPDFQVGYALQQGFSFVEDDLFYVIGNSVLPHASFTEEYSVKSDRFSAENPYGIQLYTKVPNRPYFKIEDVVDWIHTFCSQGPAQTVLFLCAMTPYMKHVLPEKFAEESVVHAYVFGESGVGKTEQIKLMTKITNGVNGLNLESDTKEILAGLAAFRDRAVQIDDLNKTGSDAVRAKKEAKVFSLLQMGSSAAGEIRAKEVNVDLSNTALLISAEYVLPNFSTINRVVLLHIREAFDSETLTSLQETRGLYGRFLRHFISYICSCRRKVKKKIADFYNREIFQIPNVGSAEDYAGFQRVFYHFVLLRLTAYAIEESLPVSKQRKDFSRMFKEGTDICIKETLDAIKKSKVTDFVKSFLKIFERDIVAETPKEYRDNTQYFFFLHGEYIYFRGKNLTDYFLKAFAITVSAKTISKELGKSNLLVPYGGSYSEKLPEKLDKKVDGNGEHYFRLNVNVLANMLCNQYDPLIYLSLPVIRILKDRDEDEKNGKKEKKKGYYR